MRKRYHVILRFDTDITLSVRADSEEEAQEEAADWFRKRPEMTSGSIMNHLILRGIEIGEDDESPDFRVADKRITGEESK